MPIHYIYLFMAIVAEVVATSAMQASAQYTRLWPSLLSICAYITALYLMSLVLKFMPVSIVYAIWSGLGVVFIAIIGWVMFRQALDAAAIIGISMIVSGVLIIHLFSSSATHG